MTHRPQSSDHPYIRCYDCLDVSACPGVSLKREVSREEISWAPACSRFPRGSAATRSGEISRIYPMRQLLC